MYYRSRKYIKFLNCFQKKIFLKLEMLYIPYATTFIIQIAKAINELIRRLF